MGWIHDGRAPSGVGVFARDQGVEWLSQWAWVALHAGRGDTPWKARELMSRGVQVWIYTTFERWRPERWRGELAELVELRNALGCAGLIANPEAGWSGQREEARRLGAALKAAAQRTRVGLVTIPLWPQLAACGEACGGKVWGAPELYAKDAYRRGGAPLLATWLDKFADAFGGEHRVCVAFSFWARIAGIVTNDPATYRQYLGDLPKSAGAIGWLTAGGPPDWMTPLVREWEPAGSAPARWGLVLLAWLSTPLGIGLAALAALFVVAVVARGAL